jgi:hypothetical protein
MVTSFYHGGFPSASTVSSGDAAMNPPTFLKKHFRTAKPPGHAACRACKPPLLFMPAFLKPFLKETAINA